MKILEIERMVLRRIEVAEVDDLMGIFSDPEAMRYYPGTKGRSEAQAWLRNQLDSYRNHGIGLWMSMLKDTGQSTGQCGLTVWKVEGQEEVEIGYLLLRKHWNRDLATEAVRACRDHGFALCHDRLVSLIDPRNRASRRVAEKVGLMLEKEVEKWGKTICVYSINKPSPSRT